MRPLLGLHAALRLLLNAIVADRGRRVERLRDLRVGGRLEVARVRGMPRPHAREAVGLELDADRCGIAALTRGQGTELVLHVVAVLVRDDVSLRERSALRAEALGELFE